MQMKGWGAEIPALLHPGRFALWFGGEVVSRALRPEIILAQAAEELFGDGSYLPVGPLPRGSLGGETDVDLPSADLARAHQRGERRIRGAEKVADLLAQLLLADPGELEHHGDDRALAALPDHGLERLLEHPLHLRRHTGQRGEEHPV